MLKKKSNKKKLKTILIGFGNFASGFPEDPRMRKYYKFCSHADVLSSHRSYEWDAVVDPNTEKRNLANNKWKIPIVVKDVKNLPQDYSADVAVVSSPPNTRVKIIQSLNVKKGLLLEKPLASNYEDAKKIKEICGKKKLITQVNFFRRANKTNNFIKKKFLKRAIGDLQCGFCIYGKGLKNNGIHYIDLVRMIFGDIFYLRSLTKFSKNKNVNMNDNFSFILGFKNKKEIFFSHIDFKSYREIYLDIWGKKGRLEFLLEGIKIRYSSVKKHRAINNFNELNSDKPKYIEPFLGEEYYDIYSNLADSINRKKKLVSGLNNAISNEYVVDRIIYSSKNNNKLIKL